MLPRVLLHTAVSVDGQTVGFDVDMAQFYSVVTDWGADCVLTGADTIVGAVGYEPDDPSAPPPAVTASAKQLLAVVDSRGRVRNWRVLKSYGQFWRDPVALVSRRTPQEYVDEVRRAGCDALVAGDERVDLRAALERLASDRGVTRVRVDSGGALSGALLLDGLVDEVSLYLQPVLAGGGQELAFKPFLNARTMGGSRAVELVDVKRLDGGVVWVTYQVHGD